MKTESRYYQIGGVVVAIHGPSFSEMAQLRRFRCEKTTPTVSYTITLGHPTEPQQEPVERSLHEASFFQDGRQICVMYQERSTRLLLCQTQRDDGSYTVCLEEECRSLYDTNLVLKLIKLPQLLLKHGGLFLHASFIDAGGGAILFTAQKQVGKSTQAGLWEHYRAAKIINGDRALLRCTDEGWMAYGSPYCGTSGICENRTLPIRAIVLLQQAKENTVRPASAREAAAAMLSGCTYAPETQSAFVLDYALRLWKDVPFFVLSCLPDEGAVSCLEKVLP